MADINNAQEKEVKVEDLLRLKRAERPDEAFWGTFDRELHQRMLQTLVKKDPWYVQLLRGVSGRVAQTAAVGAAAAFLAMLMVRPAFVDLVKPESQPTFSQQKTGAGNMAQATVALDDASTTAATSASAANSLTANAEVAPATSLAAEVAMSDLNTALAPDYQIEAISAKVEAAYMQDYAHDTFEVAGYDSAAYVADTASFAATGLATGLVY